MRVLFFSDSYWESKGVRLERLVFHINSKNILNSNVSKHYHAAAKIKRYLRQLSCSAGLERKGVFFNHFTVKVTVCPPTRRKIDPPNLYPTAKALIDGLTDAEWWEDDNFRHLLETSFVYGGLSGKKDVFTIVLDIEEVDPTNYILEAEVCDS